MGKIGIDFCKTNSVMVSYDINKGFKYFNFNDLESPAPISSTIWYHDGKKIIGNDARDNIFTYGDIEGHHFEKSIKLRLGKGKKVNIFGSIVEPADIASDIIKHLKSQAENQDGSSRIGIDFHKAVFTIPLSFDGQARKDLRKAANDAGIEVSTFIHEPFAAVVGYYFTKDNLKHEDVIKKLDSLNERYILTFDWGGGTLDITVVYLKNGKMYEKGTAELTGTAGDKFDEILAEEIWNRFLNKTTIKDETKLEKLWRAKKGKILSAAEKCKIQLSTREKAIVNILNITPDDDIYEVITRAEFEELLSTFLNQAMDKVDIAIARAGIEDVEISKILLTGGTCYIPAVQKALINKFGSRVESVNNADLVIAQGAAVISELEWLPFLTNDILIKLSDNSYWALFDKNQPIANSSDLNRKEIFTCVDQTNNVAKVILCEGDNQKIVNTIGVLNVPLLGHNRFGDDVIVEANLDKNIILNIRAHSSMVKGYSNLEKYSEFVTKSFHDLCFGLDYKREL